MKRGFTNVHLFNDGGGIVTGCQDVKLARRLLVDQYMEQNLGYIAKDPAALDDEDRRREIALASARFRPHRAKIGHGRIVPAGPDFWDSGITWFWYAGHGKIGQRGVTKAVWWDE